MVKAQAMAGAISQISFRRYEAAQISRVVMIYQILVAARDAD